MWNPEDYAKNSDAQLKWARELRSNLDLTGNESILDVGCGDEKITADFAAALPQNRVLGVDKSPQMIDYATNKYPTADYPNLAFACVDARELQFDSEFDVLFSNATLHWVDNHQAFLQGANRALRPGGRMIISCGGEGNAADILQVFAELVVREPWTVYFDGFHNPYFFYGTELYRQWLQDAGFAINRTELAPKDMTHTGKDGLAGWIRTTWMPFTNKVPQPDREKFIAEFVDAYTEKIPLDSNGIVHVGMVRLEVDAYKL